MKKLDPFGIGNITAILIGFASLCWLLSQPSSESFTALSMPAGFPTKTGLMVSWGIFSALWIAGCTFVYSVKLSPRRMRNIFLNGLILIIGIFIWHYLLFSAVNLPGTLAVSIATLLLTVIVWFMYLVTHRYGGYLFTPIVVWHLYQLYLSISLVVKN